MGNIGNLIGTVLSALNLLEPTPYILDPIEDRGKILDIENSTILEYMTPEENEKQKKWREFTIDWSKENKDYAIIINKPLRKLELYYEGNLMQSYDVGLGLSPIEDKLYMGDKCTPEGKYIINWLRDGVKVKTDFYKALHINYPTKQDSLEFVLAKERGIVPDGISSPGGAIEIHGGGGSFDWTLGCIALDNEDMDELFENVKFGTPVTIVSIPY